MHPTLLQLRKARGWTQERLAAQAGISRVTLSDLESGSQSSPRRRTIQQLAQALKITDEMCVDAIAASVAATAAQARMGRLANETSAETALRSSGWLFMAELDRDLASALARELIVLWTHGSTTLEGNTLNIGETRAILSTGVTVSGKSLQEHQEVHGHANAISLMAQVCANGSLSIGDMHELHRVIQSGVTIDVFAPTGKWKVENNGTMHPDGTWHDYAAPAHVPALMERWLDLFKQSVKEVKQVRDQAGARKRCLDVYTRLHVSFTRIHPYADGNGRMARLLANIPLLSCGLPPLLIDASKRSTYISLLAENDMQSGTPGTDEPFSIKTDAFKNLSAFFNDCWEATWSLVERFRNKQLSRDSKQA